MSGDMASKVEQALQKDVYDLQLFLGFLKSYVMSGMQPDKQLLLGILLQALPRFHTSDFSACISLIPSHVQDASYIEKELGLIYDLENYLSCGRFTQFWEVWREAGSSLAARPSFEPHMRAAILTVVASTLEQIQTTRLAVYLGLPEATEQKKIQEAFQEAAQIAGENVKLVSCDDKLVVFERRTHETPESDTSQKPLSFSRIASLVS
ncbi:putative CSN8 PSMD8 EIF3K family [Trypanosoma vivax]|nr:hypothetical protein TRVL_07251 [Trypanosoma vivax]KAH8620160.1 putative CSN8 PSMD8 EIF3K family [Trypanosoma vivax]